MLGLRSRFERLTPPGSVVMLEGGGSGSGVSSSWTLVVLPPLDWPVSMEDLSGRWMAGGIGGSEGCDGKGGGGYCRWLEGEELPGTTLTVGSSTSSSTRSMLGLLAGVVISGTTLNHSFLLTRYALFLSWDPQNFFKSHQGPSTHGTIYRSRSAVRYTRSPFETRELQSGGFLLGVFEDSLRGWLHDLEVYCSSMIVRSFKGICSFVNMSLWVQISQADTPQPRIRLFKCAVAIQRVRPVMVPPDGSKRMSSCSNSCTAFSATGFLFLLSHPSILGVTLCFCTGSYAAAAGRRFLFTR